MIEKHTRGWLGRVSQFADVTDRPVAADGSVRSVAPISFQAVQVLG